jgi:polysaccharide pyruvyl transferase WcaK-like protein
MTRIQSYDAYKKLQIFHFADFIRKQQKSAKRFLIIGNFGVYNAGDEAILAGQLAELSRIRGSKTSVVSRYPDEIQRVHHTDARSFLNPITVIKAILHADAVIVGGGGLLAKNDIGLLSLAYQFYLWTIGLFVPMVLRKPVYILGIGAYRNANTAVATYALLLMRTARIVTVRDDDSLSYLKERGIKATLFKDNSYLMQLQPKAARQLLQKLGFSPKQHNIALALKKPASKNEEQTLLRSLKAFLATHRNAVVWYFSLETNPRYPSDTLLGDALSTSKSLTGRIRFIPVSWHPSVLFAAFSAMDAVVSMRFHSAVFAYRQRIPFLGISYDRKCTSFLTSIGHPVYTPGSVTKHALTNLFKKNS